MARRGKFFAALFIVAWTVAPSCKEVDPTASWSAEELRNAGTAKLDAGDAAAARPYFEKALARGGPLAAEATYWLGMTYFRQALYDDAFNRFEQLIDRYPASDWCDDAQFMKGECRLRGALPLERDQTRVDEALDEYLTLVEEYEDSALVPQAQGRIAECRGLKAAKLMAVGKFYQKTKKFGAAAIYFKSITDDYPDFAGVAEAYFLAGECFARAGDADAAAESYRAVVTRFADTPWATAAAARLATLK